MKKDLEIRPMFVRDKDSIKGHVFICVIALIILRLIQKTVNSDNQQLSLDEIKDVLKSSDADVTRTIAMNGLGGLYAEEIISYTNIQKTKLAKDLTDEEIVELDNAIKELFNRIENEPNPLKKLLMILKVKRRMLGQNVSVNLKNV